jgi:hypothetical protein
MEKPVNENAAGDENTVNGEVAAANVAASKTFTEGECQEGLSAADDVGNDSASGAETSSQSAGEGQSLGAASAESGAELGNKLSVASAFSDETKEKAESLLQEIEGFLQHAETQVLNVGSTLWHLISHLRDAKVHAKDVASS